MELLNTADNFYCFIIIYWIVILSDFQHEEETL